MISLKDTPLYCETLTSSKYSEHVIDDLKNVGLHCNYSALDDDFFNVVLYTAKKKLIVCAVCLMIYKG